MPLSCTRCSGVAVQSCEPVKTCTCARSFKGYVLCQPSYRHSRCVILSSRLLNVYGIHCCCGSGGCHFCACCGVFKRRKGSASPRASSVVVTCRGWACSRCSLIRQLTSFYVSQPPHQEPGSFGPIHNNLAVRGSCASRSIVGVVPAKVTLCVGRP